jgi:hypothetical protein
MHVTVLKNQATWRIYKNFLIDTGKKEHPSNPRYVRNKRQYRVESSSDSSEESNQSDIEE